MTRNKYVRARLISASLIIVVALATASGAIASEDDPKPNTPIEHFIVLMQENHTFDNYFGTYPGADGIPEGTCMPVDPFDPDNEECIEPFHIGNRPIEDLDHSTSTAWNQYNEGKMDGFVWAIRQRNQDGALAMGYYDDRDLPYYWNLADEYVLFDRLFSSAHGGSVWNHMYWVAGQAGSEKNQIPPEGYGDIPMIFDRLEEAGISWKFYVQNYDPSLTYRTLGEGGAKAAQIIWCPPLNFARYIDDPELFSKIVPLDEYFEDLHNGTLPAVSYMVPSGASEHPPGSIRAGQSFVRSLIQALMRSSAWDSSAFMVVYDDWGGWYDHVPPPIVDEYGYGFRVPAFLVSPYAKRGYVDNTELDFTSALKFIQENWDLEPLHTRDRDANNITNAFDFDKPPRSPEFIPAQRPVEDTEPGPKREVIYIAYGLGIAFAGFVLVLPALAIPGRARRNARPRAQRPGGEP